MAVVCLGEVGKGSMLEAVRREGGYMGMGFGGKSVAASIKSEYY